jgi:hypothetical protein
MVHVVIRSARSTEGEECYWDVSGGAAAGDAFEQAEPVDLAPDPAIGHRRREPIGDHRARGDAVGTSDRQVRAEWTLLGRPAGLLEGCLRRSGQIAEWFRTGFQADPQCPWSSTRRERAGTGELDLERTRRRPGGLRDGIDRGIDAVGECRAKETQR